jgi:hypothetical protein
MSRYKILSEPKWCKCVKNIKKILNSNYEIDYLEKCDRIFNRDGWYFDRKYKKSWIETDGKAYSVPIHDFLYELELLNHKRLNDVELKAIEILNMYGAKNNEINKIYHKELTIRTNKAVSNRAKISRRKILGK